MAASAEDEDFHRAVQLFLDRFPAGMRAIIQRGIARGEVRADVDIELLTAMINGSFYFRSIIEHKGLDDRARTSSPTSSAPPWRHLCRSRSARQQRPGDDLRPNAGPRQFREPGRLMSLPAERRAGPLNHAPWFVSNETTATMGRPTAGAHAEVR